MYRYFLIIFITLISFTSAFSQDGYNSYNGNRGGRRPNRQVMERIHAAKIAYITDRLHLTTEQSTAFIPVYNEFEKENMDLRKSFREKNKGANPEDMSNDSAMMYVDNNLDYQEQLIKLKRKYNERYLKVISPQQLANLSEAEREFRQILMQKARQQHHNGNRWGQGGNNY